MRIFLGHNGSDFINIWIVTAFKKRIGGKKNNKRIICIHYKGLNGYIMKIGKHVEYKYNK